MFIFRHSLRVHVNIRHYTSALYITGKKASTNFVALTPYLDFEERLENRAELEENIKLRGKKIELHKYEKYWEFFKHLSEKLVILDATKHCISENLSDLLKDPEKNKIEIEKLKLHAKEAKDGYISLRDYMYPIEENAALNALAIPNIIDQRTPQLEPTILYTFGEKPNQKSENHFEVAVRANLLYYINPTFLFLQNDAAIFELALINLVRNTLLNNSFVPTVNASFGRSIIIEGCCTDYTNTDDILTVYEEDSKLSVNKLHFVGNSSIYSFMAYFAKFSIQLGYMPLKFFTSGKQYQPVTSNEQSFFNFNQYSVVDAFLISNDNDPQNMNLFENLVKIAKDIYDSLGYHYQLVYLPANELQDYESLHLSIQMYSSYSQTYVEVGSISLCGNYLSKRLLVTYSENNVRKYPNVIYCRLVNIQKLLACILEYNDLYKKELLSNELKRYVPM